MKTTIEFRDGSSETIEDVAPNIYEGQLSLLDSDANVMYDEISMEQVARVVFENDEQQEQK